MKDIFFLKEVEPCIRPHVLTWQSKMGELKETIDIFSSSTCTSFSSEFTNSILERMHINCCLFNQLYSDSVTIQKPFNLLFEKSFVSFRYIVLCSQTIKGQRAIWRKDMKVCIFWISRRNEGSKSFSFEKLKNYWFLVMLFSMKIIFCLLSD